VFELVAVERFSDHPLHGAEVPRRAYQHRNDVDGAVDVCNRSHSRQMNLPIQVFGKIADPMGVHVIAISREPDTNAGRH
jgi:hypothetical protein